MMAAAAVSPAAVAAGAAASAEPPGAVENMPTAVTEAPLLVLHRAAPCLTGAAAAAVLVDGPNTGPYGWTSVASQDGQLRILATTAFLSSSSSSSSSSSNDNNNTNTTTNNTTTNNNNNSNNSNNNNSEGASPSSPPPPLMLAHVLRPSGPAWPGRLLGHAWATAVPDASDTATPDGYHHLATLHREAVLLHATRGPASPPAPWATLRPCAEARALDLCIFSPSSSRLAAAEVAAAAAKAVAGAVTPAASPTAVAALGETLLVAVGGSFGLEVHRISTAPLPAAAAAASSPSAATATLPADRVTTPRRLLPRASVSLLRFSPCGRWLAVASLDGRVGVLDVAGEGLLLSHDNPCPYPPPPSSTSAWACAVVRGERATGLVFAHDGRRMAVACADGNVLMLRLHRERWEPCPVFLASLRATRSAAAGASTATAVSGGPHRSGLPSLPCWPALVWSPNDRRLAVSLPGAGRPCAPELAVLDAASGGRLGALPLVRCVQGMVAAPAGGYVHCVDEAGAFQVYRWAGELERRAKAAAASSALVACTPTAAAWRLANRDGEEGVLLRWCRRQRRGQQWTAVEISVPFIPTDALGPVVAGREQGEGEEGSSNSSSSSLLARGRVVVGEDALLVLFPGIAYLCGWSAAQEEVNQQQHQGDWHTFDGWDYPNGALLAAACVEGSGGARMLAVVAAQQDACERTEILLQLLSRGGGSAPPGLRLALPQKGWKEPVRWTVLTCPPLPLSPSASSFSAAPAAFVVVAASPGGSSGFLYVWRGSIDAGGGLVALDDLTATTPLRVGCPPVRPGAVLLPVELRAGSAAANARVEVRCWEFGMAAEAEEENEEGSGVCGGGVRRCWALEPGVDGEEEEQDGEGERLGWSWRMMSVGNAVSWPDPLAAVPALERTSQ